MKNEMTINKVKKQQWKKEKKKKKKTKPNSSKLACEIYDQIVIPG
jgi:hypothetical protein